MNEMRKLAGDSHPQYDIYVSETDSKWHSPPYRNMNLLTLFSIFLEGGYVWFR
jgi:hypothetical protein